MPEYISLTANDYFDEFDFIDSSIHINSINEPVSKCTDNVQSFLDNFGFLDDLAPFYKRKYAPSFEYDNDTVPLVDDPTETTAPLSFSDSEASVGNVSSCSDLDFFEDVLRKVGITLDYDKEEMRWYNCTLPLRPKGGLSSSDFDAMEDSFHFQCDDELFGEDWLQCYAARILDAKYENTNVRDVVDGLTHLSALQNADLLEVLLENQKMFDGTWVFTLTAKYI